MRRLATNSTSQPATINAGFRRHQRLKALAMVVALVGLALPVRAQFAPTTNIWFSQPLSLADAINVALEQSPRILQAKKEVEATEGVVVQTRAVALPKVSAIGRYGALEPSDVDRPEFFPSGVTFGTEQSWGAQVRLTQSLYEGGRITSALRTANLTRQQSLLNYQTAVTDTMFIIETSYYDVLLADQQITVQQASVELLSRQLADVTRRFDAGVIPRFNVLRAEVELANAKPKLIRARNDLRTTKNRLANLLGFNLPKDGLADIPLTLSGKLEAPSSLIPLPAAIATAMSRRTELKALQKTEAIRKEDIINARAGYKPSLQAFGGYDAHNTMFSPDISREVHGWITGVQVSWDLFDGLRTQGRVQEAKARYEQAGIDLEDSARRIELDVRVAHSNFIEAQDVLESQRKVLEQADEALRLAESRFQAGTGTQLDVLGAQTALTDARTTQVQALHDAAVARARLERAIGLNLVPGS